MRGQLHAGPIGTSLQGSVQHKEAITQWCVLPGKQIWILIRIRGSVWNQTLGWCVGHWVREYVEGNEFKVRMPPVPYNTRCSSLYSNCRTIPNYKAWVSTLAQILLPARNSYCCWAFELVGWQLTLFASVLLLTKFFTE